MKILVTGGLGTVGSVLAHELRSRGHEVVVTDTRHSQEAAYVRCDVASFYQLERVFERDFDVVYHLAAEFGRWNGEDYFDTMWRSNVIGTKNLIRLQEKKKFRMVFFSSSEVYGDWKDIMAEDVMDKHEVRQLNDYAMSKWVGEQQIMNSAEQFGTESVRVRLFNTYGPGEHYSPYRSAICRFIYYALMDKPYTVYLGHRRTSTYVTDTVRTLSNISDKFHPGEVYNIGGAELHDMKYPSDLILKHLGKDDRIVKYVEGEPFTTKDKIVDVTKSVRHLDHKALVSLEDGIPRTIDWMKSIYGDAQQSKRAFAFL